MANLKVLVLFLTSVTTDSTLEDESTTLLIVAGTRKRYPVTEYYFVGRYAFASRKSRGPGTRPMSSRKQALVPVQVYAHLHIATGRGGSRQGQ